MQLRDILHHSTDMQGVQFQATIWDIDPDPYGSDIIDVITLDINRTVMPGDPFLAKVITGFYNIATLNFSYQVSCDQGFYGDYCQYFMIAQAMMCVDQMVLALMGKARIPVSVIPGLQEKIVSLYFKLNSHVIQEKIVMLRIMH